VRKTSLTVVAMWATVLSMRAAHAAPTPMVVCQQSKLKAEGNLTLCLNLNSAGILGGAADGQAECQATFTAALASADSAAASAGTSCRYLDNGDGTVSDLNTGLMWEKKSPSGTGDVHDVNNKYRLSNGVRDHNPPDGGAFTVFLATLNNGFSSDGRATTAITGCFANHCDWRLPSIVELQGIVDTSVSGCGSLNPCIDSTFGPTQSSGYWSSTTLDANFLNWVVFFHNGDVREGYITWFFYVRAVRSAL
jgi:hypothetical protein